MMTAGSGEMVHHLEELEAYIPREELASILPNLTKDQASYLLQLLPVLNNDTRFSVELPSPSAIPTDHAFCDVGFRDGYKEVHGYLALMICLVGAFTNVLNMIILTRREMINSTNTILTGLAVADFLLLMEYSFYATSYIKGQESMFDSYFHSVFILFHAHYTQVTHTIAICLTITLAVWRYIAICKPHLNLFLCTLPRARLAVCIAYVVSPILSVPNYLMYSIHQRTDKHTNTSLYHVDFSDRARASNGLLQSVHFWFYSVLIKILPCLLLTFFIYHIIRAMYTAKRRKENLIKMGTPSMETERKLPRMEKMTEKTTRMLLTVLLLFLATELPQGILAFLSGVYGHSFFRQCYLHWGEVMDLLALINGAVNFLLYYIMSHQFRVTFRFLLSPPQPVNLSPRLPGETVSTQL
ncbi:G-protein coupled receptor dmsr-1-like [Homarus americanus]|uniref:Putative myosuppressin receptor IV variant 1 n=1 Tax=Homarus americanus TaxID=6706 RepID=A0A7G7X485_HOMAM|nr:G-protein coupled receptor dmsr-1-like [Homarus americanus]QNH74780.1 putative myosuppressin receptor IV variant 1 [Homarus americanus]